jgi:hypothetical protein
MTELSPINGTASGKRITLSNHPITVYRMARQELEIREGQEKTGRETPRSAQRMDGSTVHWPERTRITPEQSHPSLMHEALRQRVKIQQSSREINSVPSAHFSVAASPDRYGWSTGRWIRGFTERERGE